MKRGMLVFVLVTVACGGGSTTVGGGGEAIENLELQTAGLAALDIGTSNARRVGAGVAIHDTRMVVGAPAFASQSGAGGSAYLLEFDGNSWVRGVEFIPGESHAGDLFGASAAIRPDAVVVGAPEFGTQFAGGFGIAWVFEQNAPGAWIQTPLMDREGAPGARFGHAVAMSDDGDTVFIGAPGAIVNNDKEGGVYVYDRAADGGWELFTVIDPAAVTFDGRFGRAIAVHGQELVVSGEKSLTGMSGIATVYRRGADGMQEVATVTASDRRLADDFGASVALDEGRLVVGAPSHGSSGAVYVFERSGSDAWVLDAILISPDAAARQAIGSAVAVNGDIVLAGGEGYGIAGTVVAFVKQDGTWKQLFRTEPVDSSVDDRFGGALALFNQVAVVGSWGMVLDGVDTGAAYVLSTQTR